MVSSEHELARSSLGPAHDPSARHERLGRWVALPATATVVAALGAVLLGRAGLSAGSAGVSTSWHTYHDPFGLFTLRVPPGWAAQVEPNTGGFGDRHGIVTECMDSVSFDDPAQGTGSAYVSVFAIPLLTTLAHQTCCRDVNTPLQRFAPRALSNEEPSGVWLFTTETASFQV